MNPEFDGATSPIAILVNGGSSSGKSTLCRALQRRLAELADGDPGWLFAGVAFDDILFTLSKNLYPISFVEAQGGDLSQLVSKAFNDRRAAWEYIDDRPGADANDGKPSLRLELSPTARRILQGLHQSWGIHLKLGPHLIIDHFLQDEDWCTEVFSVLRESGARIFAIGTYCAVDEMERREAERSDGGIEVRPLGLARRSAALCHTHNINYDVVIHTDQQSTDEAVDLIIDALGEAGVLSIHNQRNITQKLP